MLIEGQRVVDRDSQAFDVVRTGMLTVPMSIVVIGSSTHCRAQVPMTITSVLFCRVQGQSIDVEPAMDCVEPVESIQHCFSIVECDVKLSVVCILSVVDPERSDNTYSDQTAVGRVQILAGHRKPTRYDAIQLSAGLDTPNV